MARVNWTPQALDDLEAIGDFIARDAPSFAQLFVESLKSLGFAGAQPNLPID